MNAPLVALPAPELDRVCDHWGGGAIALTTGGTTWFGVAGEDSLGRRRDIRSLFALYCSGKPIIAVAILTLVANGNLALDTELGQVLTRRLSPAVARTTIWSLLSHSHELAVATGVVGAALPPTMREDYVCGLGSAAHRPPAYSDYETWHLLALVIEALQASSWSVACDRMLRGVGVGEFDLMTVRPPGLGGRVSVSSHVVDGQVIAALSEYDDDIACVANPAFGAHGTLLGTHQLALLIEQSRQGAGPFPGELVELATRPLVADNSTGRRASRWLGLGFMVNGPDRRWSPPWPPSTYGHSSQGGLVSWYTDPDRGMTATVIHDSALDGPAQMMHRRRTVLAELEAIAGTRH